MDSKIYLNDELIEYRVLETNPQSIRFELDGNEYRYDLVSKTIDSLTLKNKDLSFKTFGTKEHFNCDGVNIWVKNYSSSRSKQVILDQMVSPMPGKIVKHFKKIGDEVSVGEPVLVMEAMKMEHTIRANKKGVLKVVHYKVGDQVSGGVELVEIE